MQPNASDTGSRTPNKRGPEATPAAGRTSQPVTESLVTGIMAGHAPPADRPKRRLSTTAADLMAERDGLLPVWVRAPKAGTEFYSGQTRATLYSWASQGFIRSVSIRPVAGQVKGIRCFLLSSILDFIAKAEASANAETEGVK